MDAIDRKILAVVQEDASLSVAEIGQRVGLSSTHLKADPFFSVPKRHLKVRPMLTAALAQDIFGLRLEDNRPSPCEGPPKLQLAEQRRRTPNVYGVHARTY